MQRAIEVTLVLVMIGVTLAFGGVQRLTYSLMEVALFLTFLSRWLKQAWDGEIRIPLSVWPCLLVLLVALQIIPLPTSFVGTLAAARLATSESAGLPQLHAGWTTISIYPHATVAGLFRLIAYLCAFILAADVFDSGKRNSLLVRALIYLAVFEAAYGTLQYLTGWQKIFTYTKQYYTAEATGTYINHNHLAGFLELAMPFVVGLIFYSFQMWVENRKTGWAATPRRSWAPAGMQILVYVFLMLVMVVGIIFSRSRMGILAAVFALVFVGLLAALRLRRGAWMLGLLTFLAVATCYGLWIGVGPVLARFEEARQTNYFSLEGRVSLWKDTLGLIRDYPLTGIGLGTFGIGFRHYQTSLIKFYIVDHAHNDYLEFAAETGLLGAALLFLPILYLLGKMITFFLKDSRRFRSAIVLGCIGSTLGILVHSATDFNLQVPANALIFAIVLGIGYKATCLEPKEEAQLAQQVRRSSTRQPEAQRTSHLRA